MAIPVWMDEADDGEHGGEATRAARPLERLVARPTPSIHIRHEVVRLASATDEATLCAGGDDHRPARIAVAILK
ncbi:hypothetical protein CR157_15305 [Halomonas sp. LBP4]|nr:hypothetical protein CR157_15305 [Halomonas sp. LBP4]